jgi:hypothetical protein
MRLPAVVCLILACNNDGVSPPSGTFTGPPEGTADDGSDSGAPTTGGSTTASAAETTGSAGDGSSGSTDPEATTTSTTTGGVVATGTTEVGSSSGSTTGGPPGDADGDGVPDDADDCVDVPDPDQVDTDGDGLGDACDEDDDDDDVPDAEDGCPLAPGPLEGDQDGDGQDDACDEDDDGDGVPDGDDVFPDDPDKPGVAAPGTMYAHSSATLWRLDVDTYEATMIADFGLPEFDQMTDLAIDRHGQIFGISFGRMYAVHPETAECWLLGALTGSYNGLTWIPAGTLLPDRDALIGITEVGEWVHLSLVDGLVVAEKLGQYGGSYSSAGDAFSISGVGTFAAVYSAAVPTTVIVAVDPLTGTVLAEIAVLPLSTVWGLAGWQGAIVAFDFTGEVAAVDPMTQAITPLGDKGSEWWGAGVSTLLPQ